MATAGVVVELETGTGSATEEPEAQKNLDTQLLKAAEQLDLEEVRRLLAAGASAAYIERNEGGWGTLETRSALHCAILSQCQRGPSAETPDESSVASWRGRRFEVIQMLVHAKADVNAQKISRCWTGRGSCKTAWDLVLNSALQDPPMLRLFLENGAEVNSKELRSLGGMRNDGQQVQWVLNRVVRSGNVEVARALLECGADANVPDTLVNINERGYHSHSYETPLHVASESGNFAMARLLLEHGARVNTLKTELLQEDQGLESPTDDPRDAEWVCNVACRPLFQSALHLALKGGHGELATLLVCWGADTSCKMVKQKQWNGPRSRSSRRGDGHGGPEPEVDAQVGDELTACEELCGGDAKLLKALQAQYGPEVHHLFPQKARQTVKTVLLTAKRREWPIPQRVLFNVLLFAVPALNVPAVGLPGAA